MQDSALAQVVDVDSLPTLPAVAIEAIRLMEGEPSNFESIAHLLKNDQVLVGRILHYANSSFIGARRKVSSIKQAIAVLGFRTLRSIILSVSIFESFSGKFASRKDALVNFWLHSIGVATTAEALAKRMGFPEPDEAYVAGLMHDLAKLVIFIQQPEQFERLCQELELQGSGSEGAALPLELEKTILGTNHVEFGKVLAEQWAFPESLLRVMWLHHQPVVAAIAPDPSHLPALIRFADLLCVTHNVGTSYFLGAGPVYQEHCHFALENMVLHNRFSVSDIEAIMDDVHIQVQEVGKTLGFWDQEVYQKLVGSANISLGSMSMKAEQNMVELRETNRVLSATCEMNRQLHAGLSIPETAKIVLQSARRAFNVNRCLCLIRDEAEQLFVGQLCDEDEFHEIEVPMHLAEMKTYFSKRKVSDIEAEALARLERTAVDLQKGGELKDSALGMVSGSQFLATFFVADRQSSKAEDPILGELIVDFQDAMELQMDGIEVLTRNFESLALAAGNAIERILLEQQLNVQTKDMAETSRKMEENQRQLFHSHRLATVGRLAAGAAHEINNPLTIISLNTQILSRAIQQDVDNEDMAKRLKIISDQEERISKIIQELMGFARPSQPKFCQTSVNDIVGKVLKVIGDRVSMAKIEVINKLPQDLPLAMVDPLQIEQVFMNLFINANHAMPDGGNITIDGQLRSGFLEVTVADTGEGIEPKNVGKIFDPFFTTKKKGKERV